MYDDSRPNLALIHSTSGYLIGGMNLIDEYHIASHEGHIIQHLNNQPLPTILSYFTLLDFFFLRSRAVQERKFLS